MSDFPMLLAAEMGVTRRTVQRWCEAGKVPGAYRTKGGHWRLRKPARISRYSKYDDKIVDFVMRYTSEGGYTPPTEQLESVLLNSVVQWAEHYFANPVTLSPDNARPIKQSLEWAKMVLERQVTEKMEELTACKDFSDALEF
jgi:excisionase family DNA binding protein